MQLHRATKRADWATDKPGSLNWWQRLAAETNGAVTPGNAVTIAGLLIVLAGVGCIASRQYWVGLALILVGRLFDILDGWVAQITHTKSPLGELLDAGSDKIGTIATFVVFLILPIGNYWVLAAIAIPQLLNAFLTTVATIQRLRMHPTRVGKIDMVGVWICLLGLLLAQATDARNAGIDMIIAILAIATFIGGLYSTGQYTRQLVKLLKRAA